MAIDLSKYELKGNLEKYKISEPKPDNRGGLEKFTDAIGAKGITDFLGGVGARLITRKEDQQYLPPLPSAKNVAGSALQVGSMFLPFGAGARAATAGLKAIGMTKGAGIAGQVSSGAAGGATYDVGGSLQDEPTGGLGTAIGAGVPLVPPAVRGLARVASESLGVSTGVGGGATRQLFSSSRAGGAEAQAAKDAMRGNTTPEAIVEEARGALDTIVQNRTKTYQAQLAQISNDKTSLNIAPIVESLSSNLSKFRIGMRNGALDFSQSAIRFDKKAQAEVQTIVDEMRAFGTRPGDRTAVGIDALKRALDDLYSDSSNVRSFVSSVRSATRDVLKGVKGYDEMSKAYEESTGLIKEIHRGLSLGDKAQTDTAFRKLVSALRVNNEFRKQLIQELDGAVPGSPISAKIAGQQMSELLPRGIMRSISGVGALGGLVTGIGIVPLLKAALVTSPRIVGEVLYALGYTARQVDAITAKLKGGGFPGDVLLNAAQRPKKPLQPARTSSSLSTSPAPKINPSQSNAPIKANVSTPQSVPNVKKKSNEVVPTSPSTAPLGRTSGNTATSDKSAPLGNKGAWPGTSASKPSKESVTSTGNALSGRRDVSAQKAGTSGPFESTTGVSGGLSKWLQELEAKSAQNSSSPKPNTLLDKAKGVINTIKREGKRGFIKNPLADQYPGEKDLTSTILDKLEGRTTVSKQFIQDLTNSPELRQVERDLVRRLLKDEPAAVNIKEFAAKVQTELLPLEIKTNPNPRWEGITLKDDRGEIEQYSEHIYASPIQTSAGTRHGFSDVTDRYFAHTRVEDLPDKVSTEFDPKFLAQFKAKITRQDDDYYPGRIEITDLKTNKVVTSFPLDKAEYANKEATIRHYIEREASIQHGFKVIEPGTRRVIEIQSDLFQKGRLEGEKGFLPNDGKWAKKYGDMPALDARELEVAKLEPYRNTWWERVISEEVKRAAVDKKTKLQFPTGKTAMKIERLAGDDGHVPRDAVAGDTFDYGGETYRVVGESYGGGVDVIPESAVKRTFNWKQAKEEEIDNALVDWKYEIREQNDFSRFDNHLSEDVTRKVKARLSKAKTEEARRTVVDEYETELREAVEADYNQRYSNADEMAEDFSENFGEKYIAVDDDILHVPDFESAVETMQRGGDNVEVDINDPIYRFYEKEVGRYLTKKFGAKRVTDENDVEWWEMNVSKDIAKRPVNAFTGLGANPEVKLKHDATK